MAEGNKRYEVWFWDNKAIEEYEEIYDCEFEVKDSLYGSITQFGELLGKVDNEDEGFKLLQNKEDSLRCKSMFNEASIWDNEQRYFFN